VSTRQTIEVIYRVNGTTCNDTFTAAKSSVTMLREGRTAIILTDGADAAGPVLSVQYAHAYRVLRRAEETT
jgi:hypothetical protein